MYKYQFLRAFIKLDKRCILFELYSSLSINPSLPMLPCLTAIFWVSTFAGEQKNGPFYTGLLYGPPDSSTGQLLYCSNLLYVGFTSDEANMHFCSEPCPKENNLKLLSFWLSVSCGCLQWGMDVLGLSFKIVGCQSYDFFLFISYRIVISLVQFYWAFLMLSYKAPIRTVKVSSLSLSVLEENLLRTSYGESSIFFYIAEASILSLLSTDIKNSLILSMSSLNDAFNSSSSCMMTAGVCSACLRNEVFMMLSAIVTSFWFCLSRISMERMIQSQRESSTVVRVLWL